ncbi:MULTISPECIES: GspE/PulE family protein [Enterocloster]|uniref:Type IV pilus assembly protein PilB n=1 Tax=Enterocloster lavalensis TaxID=460384 RepID=A0A1I0JP38_9FIRM|nr:MULTISPECIES: GspE/PulE family protein [Enterocloster]MDR3757140.1 ATPase, T2SS/T4P/T4SS family [Enterocloster sp.]SEU12032.1 type IV pilus assembly protein PilB [Enterocloster lavalensis]
MNIPVETLLLERGLLTERQLRRAMEFRERCPDKALEEILLDFGYVSEAALLACLGERDGLEVVDLSEYKVDPEAAGLISHNFSDQYQVLPIGIRNGKLVVAARDPLMFDVFDEIEAAAGMELTVVLAAAESIRDCAAAVYREQDLSNAVQKVNKEVQGSGHSREACAASERVEGTPIVKMVNTLIEQAYARGASDIHVEPMEDRLVIRLRVNGDLVEHTSMAMEAHRPIVTRLKIMGGMDIAEKRLPQDGKYRYDRGQVKTDLRISALPTIYGEKIVLRLLNSARDDCLMDVRRLGMTEEQEEIFERFIKAPYGLVLVTGPTGSGKTTTLYAALNRLVRRKINVVTVEDPVEKAISGATQVQVNVKSGLTFAVALRAILRQDPDVIMIGEMRDGETASIGVRAAITGHLVFSTLHTNDCAASVARLLDMGVVPYMAAAALTGVIAQRLVKELCPHCRREYEPDGRERELLGGAAPETVKRLWKPVGCSRCGNTGYSGRRAIYEFMEVDEKIGGMIQKGTSPHEIRTVLRKNGSKSLREQARDMTIRGETSMEELEKIIYSVE